MVWASTESGGHTKVSLLDLRWFPIGINLASNWFSIGVVLVYSIDSKMSPNATRVGVGGTFAGIDVVLHYLILISTERFWVWEQR